jgi:hypothetical protein
MSLLVIDIPCLIFFLKVGFHKISWALVVKVAFGLMVGDLLLEEFDQFIGAFTGALHVSPDKRNMKEEPGIALCQLED